MKTLCTLIVGVLVVSMSIAGARQVHAQTTLQRELSNGSFSYGNETFTISNCSVTDSSCGDTQNNISVIGVLNGRGGTEIELAPASGSAIFSSPSGGPDATLSFTLSITDKTGSHGLSSITNILAATDTKPADNGLVSSTLSGFTNVANLQSSSIKSAIGTLISSDSFALTQSPATSPVTLNVSINFDSQAAAGTLTLTNVKLLLNPAPEPASIALLATGATSLIAVGRRSRRLRPS